MMDTNILEEIGFTKTETKIYLALLKLGQTTTTQIIKESQINPSKVYEFLDKLVQKGLVSYVIKSNKKYFTASSPDSLKELIKEQKEELKEKESKVNELIPELKKVMKEGEEIINAEIYEGLRGIKTVYERMLTILKKGDTQYIIGIPKVANDQLEAYVLDWHKRRLKIGIKCKFLFDSDAKHYGKVREKMPLTEVKYLPRGIISPVWIEIYGDYVAIGHIKKYNAVLFLIKDKEIAKGYLDYFNLIWKVSKKE